ncbi:MAG: DUF1059 domain-containing protein [Proteobacteria bacterium]|nr:DUF1059 domain-containing protein [Pseudomonadota bacterium]MBU1736917.1 DUF1059 domain-containing protein [Pseudomonadota bacterium]
MKRYFIDCRDNPGEEICTGAFFANSKEELLELVVHHRVRVHKKRDSQDLRASIVRDIKQAPPLLRMHRL